MSAITYFYDKDSGAVATQPFAPFIEYIAVLVSDELEKHLLSEFGGKGHAEDFYFNSGRYSSTPVIIHGGTPSPRPVPAISVPIAVQKHINDQSGVPWPTPPVEAPCDKVSNIKIETKYSFEYPEQNKYQREIREGVHVDVYDVLKAFSVTCPAMQHAIKKCLAPGQRGVKSAEQDKREAIASIERSIELDG